MLMCTHTVKSMSPPPKKNKMVTQICGFILVCNSKWYLLKEQVRPNDVWTCVACSYFIYKKLT